MSRERRGAALLTALITGFIIVALSDDPAQAQRGPAFMNSPGYQRALIESRKQRQEMQQENAIGKPPAARPRHAKRKTRPR